MSLCVLAFCINMLMIDIYMSYKVMSMMLLLAGYYLKKNKEEKMAIVKKMDQARAITLSSKI